MAKKFDGVIVAVRYNRDGQVNLLRVYKIRGATYSDLVLLDRETVLTQLKSGKVYTIGKRKEFMASTFEYGKEVTVIRKNGKDFITTRETVSNRDDLEETPSF